MFDSPLFPFGIEGPFINTTICCPAFIIVFILAYVFARDRNKRL
jgi:hypothetical protein